MLPNSTWLSMQHKMRVRLWKSLAPYSEVAHAQSASCASKANPPCAQHCGFMRD